MEFFKRVDKNGKTFFNKNKNALSPTVATILMVVLILILAAIIFAWMRGFIRDSVEKNGLTAEKVCRELKFDAYYNTAGSKLSIVNEGNYAINGFEIKTVSGGNAARIPFYYSIAPASALPPYYVLLQEPFESVELFPIILGTPDGKSSVTKRYVCLHNSKKIIVS